MADLMVGPAIVTGPEKKESGKNAVANDANASRTTAATAANDKEKSSSIKLKDVVEAARLKLQQGKSSIVLDETVKEMLQHSEADPQFKAALEYNLKKFGKNLKAYELPADDIEGTGSPGPAGPEGSEDSEGLAAPKGIGGLPGPTGENKTLNITGKLTDVPDGMSLELNIPATDGLKPARVIFLFKPEIAGEIKESMDKFFLEPLKRDVALRVMTLFFATLVQEFATQMNFDIVQTKLKISSIHQQKADIEIQAKMKMSAGILETTVGSVSASVSIISAGKGLKDLAVKGKGIKDGVSKAGKGAKELTSKNEISQQKITEKTKMRQEIGDKTDDVSLQKKQTLDKEIQVEETSIKERQEGITGFKEASAKLENEKVDLTRKIDLSNTKANGYAQLINSQKGIINGFTDYGSSMMQADIKMEEAVQAGIQLSKDNARLFLQKANEYISSLLSSLNAVINSIYQARRGIVTS